MSTCPRIPCAARMRPSRTRAGAAPIHQLLKGICAALRAGGFLRLLGLCGFALQTLLARLAFDGIVLRLPLDEARRIEEARDAIRRLGADREPMLAALDVELHPIWVVLLQHRIIGANLLDVAAIAWRRAVGDHDVVIGALLCATTSKADLHRHSASSFSFICIGRVRACEHGANGFGGKDTGPLGQQPLAGRNTTSPRVLCSGSSHRLAREREARRIPALSAAMTAREKVSGCNRS